VTVTVAVVERTVEVSFAFEAVHHWPAAPDNLRVLRWPHRHLFHCRVALSVDGEDRMVEFLVLRQSLLALVGAWVAVRTPDGVFSTVGTASCEQMARTLATAALLYAADGAADHRPWTAWEWEARCLAFDVDSGLVVAATPYGQLAAWGWLVDPSTAPAPDARQNAASARERATATPSRWAVATVSEDGENGATVQVAHWEE